MDSQTAAATSRSADGVTAAVIPAVMGEGWKPLKVSHRPSENSQRATGRVAIAVQVEIGSMMLKNTAMLESRSRGLR